MRPESSAGSHKQQPIVNKVKGTNFVSVLEKNNKPPMQKLL
jgi:hypothetical protein